MNIISKIRSKLTYKDYEPLIMDDSLRDAYQTPSVVGGTLRGKTAIVTGATSGIGFAIAERLLNEGCSIIITGRSQEKLDKAEDELNRRSILKDKKTIVKALMNQYEPEEIKSTINSLFNSYDISIVINNAGFFGKKDQQRAFRSVTEEEYFQTINVNLKSTILISEISAKYLTAKGSGNILNISSICGQSRNHYYTPYGISKTGVIKFTEMLQKKCKNSGLIVNTIEPGSVATIMNHSKVNDNISGTRPLHHVIIPEQIAALAALMVSPMSTYFIGGGKMKACATENV